MTSAFGFELMFTSGAARRGRIQTAHGTVETPAFMPVGTYGTVKAMTPEELEQLGADIVLGNTFHLMLRPGGAVIRDHGGLHGFMHWRRPILTDSGGFQVWSLTSRTHVSEEGCRVQRTKGRSQDFSEPRNFDGRAVSPWQRHSNWCSTSARVIPRPSRRHNSRWVCLLRWAERCRAAFDELGNSNEGRALFGIVQGGVYPKLRIDSLDGLLEIGFDGIALGGLSVGETREERDSVLEHIAPKMPAEQPRYLMGVGTPVDILDAVCRGIDMFDCVMPTRHGRNWIPVYRDRHLADPKCALSRRSGTHPARVRMLYLSKLQPRLPATSGRMW